MFDKFSHTSVWRVTIVLVTFTALVSGAINVSNSQSNSSNNQSQNKENTSPAKQVKINLDQAKELAVPAPTADLKPASFKIPDGRSGWVIRLTGNLPIATPAYADGMLFVGGGYGSHEFYALDARTGEVRWKIKTDDDGPTAAVVQDGYVAFNTESCTVFVVECRTGRLVWKEWLGDPLLSQPAISEGRLFMASPAGQRGGKASQGMSHRLLCADLKTGRHLWEQAIPGDVITAPVVAGDRVYFTCFDGTSYCLQASDGKVIWKEQNAGTSAPVIAGNQVLMTQKEARGGKAYEGLQRMDLERGKNKDEKALASNEAEYLKEGKGGGVGVSVTAQAALDSSVGFGTAPSSANLSVANKNVGIQTVAGAWAYQGSRVAYSRGQMLNAQGRYLNSLRAADGQYTWQAEMSGGQVAQDAQIFGPPSLGKENLYLASPLGYLLAVNQLSGEQVFLYKLAQSMSFQPALVQGNIYVGTNDGLVICIETKQSDADGWYAWGGNAQHNKGN